MMPSGESGAHPVAPSGGSPFGGRCQPGHSGGGTPPPSGVPSGGSPCGRRPHTGESSGRGRGNIPRDAAASPLTVPSAGSPSGGSSGPLYGSGGGGGGGSP